MRKIDGLTHIQRAAIEGEIAKSYSGAAHDGEVLLAFYTLLRTNPAEYTEFIVEITRELLDVDSDVIDRIVLEASLNEFPLDLWVKRVIGDMKLLLALGSTEPLGRTSLNRKKLQKMIIKSAFLVFAKKIASISPTAIIELCNRILDEGTTLDFLTETCFSVLCNAQTLPKDDKIDISLLALTIQTRDILSFYAAYKSNLKEKEKKEGKERKQAETSDIVKRELDKIMQSFSDDLTKVLEKKPNKSKKFIVFKKYNNMNNLTKIKTCSTEAEAEEFVKELTRAYPDLLRTCTLIIEEKD